MAEERGFHRYGTKILTDARAAADQNEAAGGADPAGTLTFMQNVGLFNPADIPAGTTIGTEMAHQEPEPRRKGT